MAVCLLPTMKSPFDALTKDSKTLILASVEKRQGTLAKRARVVTNISKVLERHSVIFVERCSKQSLEGTPLIDRKDLKKMDSSDEMVELILERQR